VQLLCFLCFLTSFREWWAAASNDLSLRRRNRENRARITVELDDERTGLEIWGDHFDSELKDLFAIQESVAQKIADALNLHLTADEQKAVQRRYTDNPQAYDAYLRGRFLLTHFDDWSRLEAARKHFRDALNSDKNYAPALAGLSWIDALLYRNGENDPLRLKSADELAAGALKIDPTLSDAHLAMGAIDAARYQYLLAAAEFRKATQLDPNSGRALISERRFDEARSAFNRALELNPASTTPYFGLAQLFTAEGDYDHALEMLGRVDPDDQLGLSRYRSRDH
jgi:tetratricopeptide (TPR) repeat protein